MPRGKVKDRDGIYQRKDRPGWWGSWIDAQGRRRQRKFNVHTLEQARAALAAERLRVEEQIKFGRPLPSKDSFEEFAGEFLKIQERRISLRVVRGKISQAEYTRQKGIVETKLIPFFGSMKLAAVRKADVVKYIHDRTGVVSDGSIIKEVNTLKKLLNVAFDSDKIPANPAQRAPLPQAPEGRTRFLTPEQWLDVFKACRIEPTDEEPEPEQWLQWAAGLAVALGTRRGELMYTTVPDVDLDTRQVTLRMTKSGKTRAVFINDLAAQVFLAMDLPERKRKRDRSVLFPGVTPEQLSMKFIRACRAAGVEDFSFHDLRHTYASHLRMKGADLDDIRRLLGHSDLRMTIRYAHLLPEHLEAAASRLNGVLTLPVPTEKSTVQKGLSDGKKAKVRVPSLPQRYQRNQ
jgi:integrase